MLLNKYQVVSPISFQGHDQEGEKHDFSNSYATDLRNGHCDDDFMSDIMQQHLREYGVNTPLRQFEIDVDTIDGKGLCVVANHWFERSLTDEEVKIMLSTWSGQLSDGWGEGTEQQELNSEYVDVEYTCDECNGDGEVENSLDEDEDVYYDTCSCCDGNGYVHEQEYVGVYTKFNWNDVTVASVTTEELSDDDLMDYDSEMFTNDVSSVVRSALDGNMSVEQAIAIIEKS